MGAASSGGSDNDVSGAEAVATGGTTYSSRKTKTVNKEIAATNQKNRDNRRSPIAKILSYTPGSIIMNKFQDTKFVKDSNYKSRVEFAKKSGKFTNTDLSSREFVLSKSFKTQLDGMGYSERNNTENNNSNNNTPTQTVNTPAPTIIKKTAGGQTVQTTAPTEAELSQSAAADAEAYDLRKTKKRGRSMTTLTSSRGVTDNKLTLGKPSLLGA